jgi:uncharacterized membrane protein YhhN
MVSGSPVVLVALTAVAVLGLLWATKTETRTWQWVFKPTASTLFLGVALASSALETTYGTLILLGLVFSWLGDVLLIPKDQPNAFKAGVLSFGFAHLAYAAAFVTLGQEPTSLLAGVLCVAVAALLLAPRIRAGVPAAFKGVVLAYMVVISIMLAVASGASGAVPMPWIFIGALLFYLSDLAVARERFFESGFENRLFGLPAYYAAQVILAMTCAYFV